MKIKCTSKEETRLCVSNRNLFIVCVTAQGCPVIQPYIVVFLNMQPTLKARISTKENTNILYIKPHRIFCN